MSALKKCCFLWESGPMMAFVGELYREIDEFRSGD